jgi:hypothetical protein
MTGKTTKPAAKGGAKLPPLSAHVNSAIQVGMKPGDSAGAAVARTLTRPEVTAAAVIESWAKDTHDVNALAAELGQQVRALNSGDMRRAEGLLIAQAHALDAIFTTLARRATAQDSLHHWETYMRMAMKAQAQCRATLEALAAVKNPPVFARQANIAHGPQQVNNGPPPQSRPVRAGAHAGEPAERRNELLEGGEHGERLDTGAARAAGGADPHLAPVGTVNGPAHG